MVSELLKGALKALGKPVYRLVYNPKDQKNKVSPQTYFTFQTILSQPSGYADDDSTATLHTFRVDLYSKLDFSQLLSDTLTALKQAGFTISVVDAEMYENDTGYYHVPITIKIMEE
jgi:hypothetical protein